MNDAFWTAAVGIAGIAGAFFAPTYTQTKIERRRERRTFQRAQRLVVSELRHLAEQLDVFAGDKEGHFVIEAVRTTKGLATDAWGAEMQVLADGAPHDVWVQLTDIYRRIDLNRRFLLQNDTVSDSLRQIFRTEAELARAAADSLDQAVGDFA